MAAGLLGASPLVAQVEGRAVRVVGGDSLPAAGAIVTLHRVGLESQGPIDSVAAAADGSFSFATRPDSGDVLLVSVQWHGVEYFAPPVVPGRASRLVAVDTSSSAVVGVAARHVIIGGPAADGTRDVIDLTVIENNSGLTRAVGDTTEPTWAMVLPPRVANLAVGDADFARDAFDSHGDSLQLHAPIPPGQRQFFLQYQLAPNTVSFELPLDPRPDTLSVLTEELDLDLGRGLVRIGVEQLQGREFVRFGGGSELGNTITVEFPDSRPPPGWLLPLLLVLVALPLAWATRRILLSPPSS